MKKKKMVKMMSGGIVPITKLTEFILRDTPEADYRTWLQFGNQGTMQDFLDSIEGAGGGTGAVTVPDDHFFATDAERDAFFGG